MMALVARGHEEDKTAILKARAYLVGIQTDWDVKGEVDNTVDRGIGYGSSRPHSDLSNTLFALEALHHTRSIGKDSGAGKQPELDWEAARTFITRCQNLTATNDQEWASDDPTNKGGFVHFPGDSKAGEQEIEDGRTALRSSGSISYAGLLSLVYPDFDKEDRRIEVRVNRVTLPMWVLGRRLSHRSRGAGPDRGCRVCHWRSPGGSRQAGRCARVVRNDPARHTDRDSVR